MIHPRARVGETATGPAHVAGTAIEFDLFPHDPMGHAPLSDAEWADRVAVRMRARWGLRHKLAWPRASSTMPGASPEPAILTLCTGRVSPRTIREQSR